MGDDVGSSTTWLQNASFSPALFNAPSSRGDAEAADRRRGLLAQAETSSESGSGQEGERKKRGREEGSDKQHRKKKRKEKEGRKRSKTEQKLASLDARARAAGPRASKPELQFSWAEDAERLGKAATDCIDRQRENDNLVFEKPYLMNIPTFRRVLPRWSRVQAVWDDSLQADPRRKKRRRFTTKRAKFREADKEMARLRFGRDVSPRPPPQGLQISLPQPSYIALSVEDEGRAPLLALSEQDQLRQRTAELNRATIDHPEDLQAWLDFAAFQDSFFGVSSASLARKARLQRDAAEKRVDVLQKALQHHPGSDQIVLQLLQSAMLFEEEKEAMARWQTVLGDAGFSRSWRLWEVYIGWLKSDVLGRISSESTVQDVRGAYCQALKAVAKGRLQLLREQLGKEADEAEAALVDLLVSACRFDLQAGYTELGIARIQAALEYVLLSPSWSTAVPGPGGDVVRKPLFEQFWNSGAPLIGENGCCGWQEWAIAAQNQRSQLPPPPEEPEEEPGGWSGWMELEIPAPPPEVPEGLGSDSDEDAVADEEEENLAREQRELEEMLQEEAAKLQAGGSIDAGVVEEWMRWERYRERCEWQPARPRPPGTAEEEAEPVETHPSKTVEFDDIEPGLFSLVSVEHQRLLAFRLLSLLDTPLGHWQSSNSPAALSDVNSRASVGDEAASVLLHGVTDDAADPLLAWLSPDWLSAGLEAPLFAQSGTLPWFQADPSRRRFLISMLKVLLRSSQLSEEACLCDALVAVAAAATLESRQPPGLVGELEDEEEDSSLPLEVIDDAAKDEAEVSVRKQTAGAVREVVGELLRHQSQGSPLWTAYASHEAIVGSVKKARKAFDMYLVNASLSAGDAALRAAPLVLAYATAEVKRKASSHRAVAAHALCWLADPQASYRPLDERLAQFPSATRIADARKGFQGFLSRTATSFATGPSEEKGAAICAAALFEELLDEAHGTAAAARLLGNAISGYPIETRRESVVLEQLIEKQCKLLWKASLAAVVPPKAAWNALDAALQVYPQSIRLMHLLARVQQRAYAMSQLRLRVTMACDAHACAPLWLLAARIEAVQLLAHHRMKQLFKRSEKHEQLDASPQWRRVQFSHAVWSRAGSLDVTFTRLSGKCPWVKDVWLDGFQQLQERKLMLAEAEKREIRIRTSLENVILTLASRQIMG